MQKVVSILGESFNRHDIEGDPFPGFTRYDFNNAPAWYTYQAFICLQSEMIVNEWRLPPDEQKPCLGYFTKTKIIAQGFEDVPAIRGIDPTIDDKYRDEPETYEIAHKFIVDFPHNDYQHVMIHTDYGHAAWFLNRFGETPFRHRSEWGVPKNLYKTFARWKDCTHHNLLKFIDDTTTVLIHNDHGTMRSNKRGKKNLQDGFLFVRSPHPQIDLKREIGWADIRMTLATLFGTKKQMNLNYGESFIRYDRCDLKLM